MGGMENTFHSETLLPESRESQLGKEYETLRVDETAYMLFKH